MNCGLGAALGGIGRAGRRKNRHDRADPHGITKNDALQRRIELLQADELA